MFVFSAFYQVLRSLLVPRLVLVTENLVLRQQLVVLQGSTKRPELRRRDRLFWVALQNFMCLGTRLPSQRWQSRVRIRKPLHKPGRAFCGIMLDRLPHWFLHSADSDFQRPVRVRCAVA